MALTSRQLRALFAKLKQKRRGSFFREPPHLPLQESGLTRHGGHLLDRIFSDKIAQAYEARLPQSHRKLAEIRIKGIRIWDQHLLNEDTFEGTSGLFDLYGRYGRRGLLHVVRNPDVYSIAQGYTNLPSHVPRGVTVLSAAIERNRVRNAKLGAASTFYHEYGHAVRPGLGPKGRRDWQKIVLKSGEWKMAQHDVDNFYGIFGRKAGDPLSNDEAFAEAYAFYATSKVSNARLKRDRPQTYAWMRSFFQ